MSEPQSLIETRMETGTMKTARVAAFAASLFLTGGTAQASFFSYALHDVVFAGGARLDPPEAAGGTARA